MTTLATYSVENDHGYERTRACIMESRNGGEDYWFVFDTAERLEAVIPFDWVEFRTRPTDEDTIMAIEFYRTSGGRMTRKVKAGQVEGGRLDWGDEIVDTLEAIRDGELNGS